MIHMKYQALFSLKNIRKKKLKMLPAAVVVGALSLVISYMYNTIDKSY